MTDTAAPAKPARAPKTALNATRSFWLKQLHQWHWISAALSLIGLLLFAVTGITLNHAAQIPAEPVTVEQTGTLPAPLLARLAAFPVETTDPVPDAVARWALADIVHVLKKICWASERSPSKRSTACKHSERSRTFRSPAFRSVSSPC